MINCIVSSFKSKQDRVIGVEMHGKEILYQGKPIEIYMIINLDLMEGRYCMINNNFSAAVVKKVQVVENDQPIKIFFSDRASLNLKLKKFTSTCTGKIDLGYEPGLWNLNLTTMTFGRTFQILNSCQMNNLGNCASNDLRAFYWGSFFENRSSTSNGESFLAVRNLSRPSFDKKNGWTIR